MELLLVNGPAVRVCQLWIFGTEKMKVVAEIEFFRTNHARPADSAWKCPNGLNSVVGGTSDCWNPITIRPCSSDTPTSDFGSPGRQNRINESCSRDRALSNQPCPTGRFRLEVPQWIDSPVGGTSYSRNPITIWAWTSDPLSLTFLWPRCEYRNPWRLRNSRPRFLI